MSRRVNPVRSLLVWCVRGYQEVISPGLPGRCKYHPSCSQYAIDALTQYGVLRGFVLACWRVLRCNPLSYGGYDPVERQTVFAARMRMPRTTGDRGVRVESGQVGGFGPPDGGDRPSATPGQGAGLGAGGTT